MKDRSGPAGPTRGRSPRIRPQRPRGPRRKAWVLAVVVAGLIGLSGPPAAAHEGGTAEEGYVMVQQAIVYLTDMAEPEATMHAQEKVSAALAAADQEGVSLDQVRQAQGALQAGDPDRARSLLQDSIAEAVKALEPAKGVDTGTGVVSPPLAPQPVTGFGWAFLVLSVLAIGAGIWLAALFRPHEGVSELRRLMGVTGRHAGNGPVGTDGGAR